MFIKVTLNIDIEEELKVLLSFEKISNKEAHQILQKEQIKDFQYVAMEQSAAFFFDKTSDQRTLLREVISDFDEMLHIFQSKIILFQSKLWN